MSFADYGFDIFPYSIQDHGCGGKTHYAKRVHDSNVPFDLKELDNLGNLCYNVIDHLVDLGINTENELLLAKQELQRYKTLQRNGLHEAVFQNNESEGDNSEDSERFIQNTNLDSENQCYSIDDANQISGESKNNSSKNTTWNLFPRLSLFGKKNVKIEPKIEENKLPEENEISPRLEVSDESTETHPDIISVKEEEIQTTSEKDEEEEEEVETVERSEEQEVEAPERDGEEEAVEMDTDEDAIRTLSDESFRTAIIEKDSEIICLKNENAVKDAELKELEDHNKKLEDMIGKLKCNIEILEKTSRISEAEIQELIRKKNEEITFARHNNIELEQELKEERKARILDEREVIHLRSFIQETQACHKNINDELKVTKRRLETIESSNASYAATIKLLQHERDELDKINGEQEIEIKKLLNIIQRLREKYDSAKEELYSSTEELLSRERQVDQCRKQLETTELEVSKLIADLAECLGRVAHIETTRICTISSNSNARRPGIYAQAREMTRALDKIVQEHLHCNAHRADLMKEIGRLRAREEERCWNHSKMIQVQLSSDGTEGTPSDSDMENSNLGQSVDQVESNQSILTSTKDTGDEGLEEAEEHKSISHNHSEYNQSIQMNSMETVYEDQEEIEEHKSVSRKNSESSQSIETNSIDTIDESLEETEELTSTSQSNLEHVDETVSPPTDSDQKIIDELEKIKCESFLIQELDSLQRALDEALKISIGLDLSKTTESKERAAKEIYKSEIKRFIGERIDYSELEYNLFGPVLQRLQNFTRIVIKIIAVLRIDSDANIEHLKYLEEKIEITLTSLRDADFEKYQLQKEVNKYQKKCEELTDQIQTLEVTLNLKSDELSALIDEKTSRFESWCEEVEAVREQLTTVEERLNDSLAENLDLIEKSETLQRELQKKDEKLQEYGKFNEHLVEKSETLKRELREKVEKSETLQRELQEKVEKSETLQRELQEKDEKVQEYVKFNELLNEKSESLLRVLQEKDEKLEKYGKFNEHLNEKSETLLRELQEKDEKLQEYGKFNEHLVEKSETLERELQKKDEKLQEYGKFSERLVEKSETLERELEKKDEKLQEYGKFNERLVEKSETLKRELQDKVEKSETLLRELQEKDEKVQEYVKFNELLNEKSESLLRVLQEKDEKLEKYGKFNEHLNEKSETLQRELQEKDEKLQEYGKFNEHLVEKSKTLERELQKKDEKLQEYEKLNERLVEKSETLKRELQEKVEKSETLLRELQEKDEKLQECGKFNEHLNEKSETLQRELHKKDEKLQEYGKFNEHLNDKLMESNKMIEQLQTTIRQESVLKAEFIKFEKLHDRIRELIDEKEKLTEKLANMNSQLSSYEKSNATMQNNFNKIIEDNKYLEKCIETFKNENQRLEESFADKDDIKNKIATQFDGLLYKIEKISNNPKKSSNRSSSLSHTDVMIRALEKDVKSHKEKLRIQQKELQSKEQEISDKNKRIETLNSQICKAKLEVTTDNSSILKRIEILTLEKAELRSELKQTLSKYEDKLAEMHKQFKQNEIELHKNHNESIKRLETKYIDIMKEEEKPFNFETWLQSLNSAELQKIHDKVCTSLRRATHDKDPSNEHQRKRNFTSRSAVSSCIAKKSVAVKKDAQNIKASSTSRPGSPFSLKSKKSATSRSMSVPDREYISFRSKKLNF